MIFTPAPMSEFSPMSTSPVIAWTAPARRAWTAPGPPGVDGTGAATPVSAGGAPAAAGPRSADGYQARRFRAPRRTSLLGTRSAVTDAGVVTARNLRHFIRQPQLLIFSTIQPVMFVLLFA